MLEKNLHVLAPRMTRLLSIASTILITLSRSLTAGAYLDSATVSGAAVPAARAGVSPAKDNAGGTPGAAGETPAPLWATILVVVSRCAGGSGERGLHCLNQPASKPFSSRLAPSG